jgi:ribosomal protein L30E
MEEEITVLDEVKKNLKSKKLVYGTETTLKGLKLGKISKVFVSSNAPASVKEDLDRYAGLAGAAVLSVGIPNGELGIFCKKSHLVSVIGLLK